jgi:putative PIN family toxin of toxin-antitoxin system
VRVAIDTDVLVAGLRSPRGASRALLQELRAGRLVVVASVALMLEYEAVVTRPEHLAVIGLSRDEVNRLLDGLAALVEPVTPHFLWRPQLRDPDDEMLPDTAVAGHCDAIVTFNSRDFLPAARRFGLEVLLPRDIIRRLQ